jgi:hypothetical protein
MGLPGSRTLSVRASGQRPGRSQGFQFSLEYISRRQACSLKMGRALVLKAVATVARPSRRKNALPEARHGTRQRGRLRLAAWIARRHWPSQRQWYLPIGDSKGGRQVSSLRSAGRRRQRPAHCCLPPASQTRAQERERSGAGNEQYQSRLTSALSPVSLSFQLSRIPPPRPVAHLAHRQHHRHLHQDPDHRRQCGP